MLGPDTGKFHSSYIGMNVCGSTYENGCMVDGMCATAADYYYKKVPQYVAMYNIIHCIS